MVTCRVTKMLSDLNLAAGEFMLTFALFPIVLFFLGALLVTGLPVAMSLQAYFKNRGRQSAICPENGEPVDIELDNKYSFWTALRGQEHTRLHSCTRWPEKGDCGQECLAQVDPSPENVARLEQHKLVELRQVNLRQLQSALEHMRPLCWTCHQEERVRQFVPPRVLKGDRHGLSPAATRLSSEVEAL